MLGREKSYRFLSRWARWLGTAILLLGFVGVGPTWAQDTSRKVIARTAPGYPELAKKMHLAGKVKVEVVISAGGSVISAKTVGGNPVFEANALEAVKQWKFESAAGPTKTVITLEFAGQGDQ